MANQHPIMAMFAASTLMVSPTAEAEVNACINAIAAHPRAAEFFYDAPSAEDTFWPEPDSWLAQYRPYVVDADGILHIPVKGVLLNDFGFALGNYATGYDYIWQAFKRGLEDSNVKGIALIINSPGGLVAGNFELVDKMYARRGEKPLRAFAADHAYSAAYSICSVADLGEINVTRTGGVGSIGVVIGHMDVSQAMATAGYKMTFIHYGKHKVDGNPYEPLPADVKARIQSRIDEMGEIFVSTVARNRGMDEKAIRDTEALTFTASEAVANGLADKIGTLEDAVAAFAADLSSTDGDEEMSNNQDTAAANEAAVNDARTEGRADGFAAGATAERTRIAAILDAPEAEGKQKLARHLAFATGSTAEDAIGMLAVAAAEAAPAAVTQPAATQSALDLAMSLTGGGPGVAAEQSEEGAEALDGEDVLALIHAHGLKGFKAPAAK